MISVIIPAYNAEKTIKACIDSLLQGSFQDFEILISDDGSRDSTRQICESIADNRLQLLPAAENGGVSRARNRALSEARGEYVCFVDADDTVTGDFLESLYEPARQYQLDWSAGGFSFVDEKDPSRVVMEIPYTFEEDTLLKEDQIHLHLPGKILYNGARRTLSSACCGLYRLSLIKEHALAFQEGLRYGEDTSFNLFFSAFCRSFAYVARALYLCHQHEGSTTDNLFTRYKLADFTRLTELTESFRLKNGWPVSRELTNYIGSQAFGFLNHNAYLLPEKRKAYYKQFEEEYFGSPQVRQLWEKMRSKDMEGRLQRIRFSLIKSRHYELLYHLQRGIRSGKKLLPGHKGVHSF